MSSSPLLLWHVWSQYLDALEVLITAYDDKHNPILPDDRTPLQRLNVLLKSSGTTPARLQEVLNASQSMDSMILNGRRDLSKKAIFKLAEYSKLNRDIFCSQRDRISRPLAAALLVR